MIETAEVTETPLFLEIARQLHGKGLLAHAGPRRRPESSRGRRRARRTGARAGRDRPRHAQRRPGVAAAASARDLDGGADRRAFRARSADDALAPSPDRRDARRPGVHGSQARQARGGLRRAARTSETAGCDTRCLIDELQRNLLRIKECQLPGSKELPVSMERELRLAAGRGLQLGLVEPLRDGVRFPHSLLQSYFASRVIAGVIEHDETTCRSALEHASRELLIALVMLSRRRDRAHAGALAKITAELRSGGRDGGLSHAKAIDAFVAALEVDCVADHQRIVEIAADLAAKLAARERRQHGRGVEAASDRALRRVARTIAEHPNRRVPVTRRTGSCSTSRAGTSPTASAWPRHRSSAPAATRHSAACRTTVDVLGRPRATAGPTRRCIASTRSGRGWRRCWPVPPSSSPAARATTSRAGWNA